MKILLIDHHESFRSEFRSVLQRLTGGAGVLLEADDFPKGLERVARNPGIDLVLLELSVPGCRGGDSVRSFCERFPSLPLVLVSSGEDSLAVSKALGGGACGAVCKLTPEAMLLDVLGLIFAGDIKVPPRLFKLFSTPRPFRLTERQRQVLACLAEGLSNKEISEKFDLAEGTVKVHVAALCQTLGVRGRREAVRVAGQFGLGAMPGNERC